MIEFGRNSIKNYNIFDVETLESTDFLANYDVCIIGTGPAGMTLCAELANSGLRICVLESGTISKTKHADSLRKVRSEGILIKEYSRERFLGGASNTWSGLSGQLDSIDMSERSFLSVPGWPITHAELQPYWEAASERYRFATKEIFNVFEKIRSGGDLQPQWGALDEKIFIAASEPQNFGKEWKHIFNSESVHLFLNATVGVLKQKEGGDDKKIEYALVHTPSGKILQIHANVFVLATGGIENARLLLASNNLGNEHDQVGRYLMNHPKNNHGVITLTKAVHELPYFFGCLYRGYAGYAGVRLSEKTQLESRILNSYVRFMPLFAWSGASGVEGFIFLIKQSKLFFSAWKRRAMKQIVSLRDYAETGDDSELQNSTTFFDYIKIIARIIVDMPMVLRYVHARLRKDYAPAISKICIRNFMEMEPYSNNRVTLSEERDSNGHCIAFVTHDTTELDRRSLIDLHRELKKEIKDLNIGVFETELDRMIPWAIDSDASHHMGTTRTGSDPQTSVVNKDLKLHSVPNVYVAGASVFATSGCVNPTYTICALSIRLAEHLKKNVSL